MNFVIGRSLNGNLFTIYNGYGEVFVVDSNRLSNISDLCKYDYNRLAVFDDTTGIQLYVGYTIICKFIDDGIPCYIAVDNNCSRYIFTTDEVRHNKNSISNITIT